MLNKPRKMKNKSIYKAGILVVLSFAIGTIAHAQANNTTKQLPSEQPATVINQQAAPQHLKTKAAERKAAGPALVSDGGPQSADKQVKPMEKLPVLQKEEAKSRPQQKKIKQPPMQTEETEKL
jgi:hypothetical protein